jgi:hypothetical protein
MKLTTFKCRFWFDTVNGNGAVTNSRLYSNLWDIWQRKQSVVLGYMSGNLGFNADVYKADKSN